MTANVHLSFTNTGIDWDSAADCDDDVKGFSEVRQVWVPVLPNPTCVGFDVSEIL